jgi:hypothetical protein
VLKLWLERKTLPEYLIRQQIRELESMNEASFSTASLRRGPMRTERAINDPLREMEGMLDEYGRFVCIPFWPFLVLWPKKNFLYERNCKKKVRVISSLLCSLLSWFVKLILIRVPCQLHFIIGR